MDARAANDTRRHDPRRALCEELAETLASDDGLRAARLLHLASPAAEPPPPAAEPAGEPRPISIWRPRNDGGERVFERPAPLPHGDHYAARRVIRQRKAEGRRRVAFFGESAAAGYLYAPRLTPAATLETQLAAAGAWEVVDLARTNETVEHLAATVRSSLQLAPDVLVIFTGNNWNLLETPEISPFAPSVEGRQRYAQALADAGPAGPARLAERTLARRATDALDAIARHAATAGVPVIVVVPEVNLADWESRQPAPWLPGDGSARWHALYREAVDALERGDGSEAAARAEQMRRLDGGVGGTAWRILARAELARERSDAARRACRAEIDATSYATLAFLDAPRASSRVQDLLRSAAERHGWGLVDLPRRFAGHALPGRELFLDYCHLTSEAIRLATAAVAAEVVRRVEEREVPERAFLDVAVDVPAEVEATARLGAAIHGAHRLLTVGGARPILRHWCRRALAASAGVADAMLDLIAARAAPGPAVLTAAQARNHRSPYPLTPQHGWRWDFVDAELVETLCGALEEAGRPAREEAERLFADGLAVSDRGVELSEPPYLWEPLERFYPEVMETSDLDRRGTLRAPWPTSSFCLVHAGDGDLTLQLTARLPAIPGFSGARSGAARVLVNGREAARCELGEGWTRQRLRVARCRRGWNRVDVEWPPLPPAGDAALEHAIRRLEVGREAEIHPVFGEIHALTAARR